MGGRLLFSRRYQDLCPFLASNLLLWSPFRGYCPDPFVVRNCDLRGGDQQLFCAMSTSRNNNCDAIPSTIPISLRGVFVGSGSDGMSDPRITKIILDLVRSSRGDNNQCNSANDTGQTNIESSISTTTTISPVIVYIGTATYDLPQFAERQTRCFVDSGCQVEVLNLAHSVNCDDSIQEIQQYARDVLSRADVVVIGGGNTLYAIDRWKKLGVDLALRDAMNRGVVLTGGSAGAICWFDGGHSDSCDPGSFYEAMMTKFGGTSNSKRSPANTAGGKSDKIASPPPPDESAIGGDEEDDGSGTTKNNKKDWKYIRVSGLGFIPGLCCPHHDRIQSNGVLRADDFDQMLLSKHSGEVGIAIDHWAALVVNGHDNSYRVVSLEGKKGSVVYGKTKCEEKTNDNGNINQSIATFSRDAAGVPGVWIKEVVDDETAGRKVAKRLLQPTGRLSDFVREASFIVEDEDSIQECRRINPDC